MSAQLTDVDYITSLQARVKELEAENANLLSRLANCHCSNSKTDKKLYGHDDKAAKVTEPKKPDRKSEEKIEKKLGYNTKLMSHHSKRYIALKVMYFGKRFYGFSAEAQMEPSVESEIFKALERARLLVGDMKESQYSRCGRTDKGVSSVGQVIALFLRSKLKKSEVNNGSFGEMNLEEQHGELDYVRVINRELPNDIRVLGWCPVPVDFHARFSCLSREYRYFFWKENLNILAMESAGRKLVGEHDFRNFCKMDAANVHIYTRRITMFEIYATDVRYDDNQLWVIKFRGSAFLWHQVRCMIAVLFLIGKGLESPDVGSPGNLSTLWLQRFLWFSSPVNLKMSSLCVHQIQEKSCMRTWLMNVKFTIFKLQSFTKLFLIVCLNYMIKACHQFEDPRRKAPISQFLSQTKACHQFEDPGRKAPISLSCYDQLSHLMKNDAPNSAHVHDDFTGHLHYIDLQCRLYF